MSKAPPPKAAPGKGAPAPKAKAKSAAPKSGTVEAKLAPKEAVLNPPAADHMGRVLIDALNHLGSSGQLGPAPDASAGPAPMAQQNAPAQSFKAGTAKVPGKGSSKVDSVPAKLAPGQAVLNAAATAHVGHGLINHLNKMGAQQMGMPPGGPAQPTPANGPPGFADGTGDTTPRGASQGRWQDPQPMRGSPEASYMGRVPLGLPTGQTPQPFSWSGGGSPATPRQGYAKGSSKVECHADGTSQVGGDGLYEGAMSALGRLWGSTPQGSNPFTQNIPQQDRPAAPQPSGYDPKNPGAGWIK